MLHSNVMAAEKPEYVVVEQLPDGTKRVILSKNATAVENEDGESWVFDQADFCLEPDREETKASIQDRFDSWWDYAVGYNQGVPTLTVEQRLENMENALLAMMGL